jgi:hypothetical protein
MQLVYLAHGIVEDGGDDAAVAVAGRSGVTLAQAKAADEGLAIFIEDELEAHAVGIVHAADEAVVLLHFDVAGVVTLGLAGHGIDFNLRKARGVGPGGCRPFGTRSCSLLFPGLTSGANE